MATISKKEQQRAVHGSLALAQILRQLPATKLSLDYDSEADVLYISLKRPQKATTTVELENGGILRRYRGRDLVGVTVLNASHRAE
jgi:uncharacterized protein YuzE